MYQRCGLRIVWFVLIGAVLTSRTVLAQAPLVAPAVEEQLTLEQCVNLALEYHPQLFEGTARIDEARGGQVQAGLYPNPRLDSGNPQTIGRSPSSIYSFGFTQEILRKGKRQLDVAAAGEGVRSTEWDLVRRRFEIITAVRQDFYSTLSVQQREAILGTILTLAKRSEKTSQDLFKAEQVSETDLLLLRVERQRAEASLQSVQMLRKGRLKQLAATMGVPQIRIDKVDGDLAIPIPEFDDASVLNEVVSNSPFVQIANIDVNRAMLLLQRAELEPKPNFTVQGGYQFTQNAPHDQALVGVYVDIPIWNRNQGNIMAAGAAVRRTVAMRDQVQNSLTRQLADAISRFRSANEQVRKYEEGILPDAKRTLTLVQSAYARGQFDISRLLQTQRSYFEANLDYINAQESRLLSASEVAGLLRLDQFPTGPAVAVPEPEPAKVPNM
ncbi:MAG: TolC family protein [Planctomycetaceae bacterium]|nr:TolC family protein [Planctomycetaceae bacterium]